MSLAIEQMAREIRSGYHFCRGTPDLNNPKGSPTCHDALGNVVSGSSTVDLIFQNANNETVTYTLIKGLIERGITDTLSGTVYSPITGSNVLIRYLNFNLLGNLAADGLAPRITITLGVSAKEAVASQSTVNLETTISARQLDS